MYKIKDLRSGELKSILGDDRCEYLSFDVIKNSNTEYDFVLLAPIPGNEFKNISDDIITGKNVILNDLGMLEFIKNKDVNLYIGRLLMSSLTRSFKNINYLLDKLSKYNIKGIFINYSDYFNISVETLNFLASKNIKIGLFVSDDIYAYSPRCHYLVTQKEKGDLSKIDCKKCCETMQKDSFMLGGYGKLVSMEYKALLNPKPDLEKLKEDIGKINLINYFVY